MSRPLHRAPPRPVRRSALVGAAVVLAVCTVSGGPVPPRSDQTPPHVAREVSAPAVPDDAARTESPASRDAQERTGPAPDQDAEVRLAVVGDIMLGRKVGEGIQTQGTDAVLAGVREELHDADLTIGNLESPLCSGGTPDDKAYPLRADPSSLDVLSDGSFDLVSLANNHILDFGPECMDSTTGLLAEADIAHVGVGQTIDAAREPVILERNGMRIAFLGYLQMPVERSGFDSQEWTATDTTPGLAWADPAVIAADVQAAQIGADHVIVLLHSGFESTEHLSPEQQDAGNAALEAGATAVLGAHPHQLQAAHDRGDGSLVAWSLGNFVFDYPNGWTESDSAVLHLTLGREGVRETEWTPVLIQDGFPTAVSPHEGAGARILGEVDRMSREYAESLR